MKVKGHLVNGNRMSGLIILGVKMHSFRDQGKSWVRNILYTIVSWKKTGNYLLTRTIPDDVRTYVITWRLLFPMQYFSSVNLGQKYAESVDWLDYLYNRGIWISLYGIRVLYMCNLTLILWKQLKRSFLVMLNFKLKLIIFCVYISHHIIKII